MNHPRLRGARLVALPAIVLTLAAALLAPTSAVAKDKDDKRGRAQEALAMVEGILSGNIGRGSSRPDDSRQQGVDLTMAMRDLFLTRDALSGKEQERADSLLARPTDGSGPAYEPKYPDGASRRTCSSAVCVHYVTGGRHAASRSFAVDVRRAVTTAHQRIRGRGFRGPLNDAGRGGDNRPDVYLADIGRDVGVFGYAVADRKNALWGRGAGGYVVLDNNFSEFCSGGCGAGTADRLMRATAAHEYFHVVQFAYDYAEDVWFMEATATWIEDEVFDDVNDNVNFLYSSPSALQTPRVPIDAPDANPYANWILFRNLSERYGAKVVRKAWQKADAWRGYDGSRNPKDHYSLKALQGAVDYGVGGNWTVDFANFAMDNRRPGRAYQEGSAQNYPAAPLKTRFRHFKDNRKRTMAVKRSHLSSATYRYIPAGKLRYGWRLRVRVHGLPHGKGGYAMAEINKKGGGIKRVFFYLGGDGKQVKKLPYGKSKVNWIEFTVVNASTRYRCNQDRPDNTCDGVPQDENENFWIATKAVR
ncbi:hypothetical protein KUV85_10340 [Nocardioides panacisoli]|uniref:MXAN_6640 family putative metalloprotease n=1 Tax=Nocardioides panacisoli TaxID=627624 RepID=UPI001C635359|nr:MXAN_6640 family putative metalloprotease [Nocardioides panacisoli]QYJ02737.1 hypothetical protein KUV85_10340 [Nocardioides panacisoli]